MSDKKANPSSDRPNVVILAGPNGAGKSAVATILLKEALAVSEFVNADTIARGLSEFNPGEVAIAAGRIMLQRLRKLFEERATFAFETTLASRSFVPWLRRAKASGYGIHLVFLWLPSPDLAIARVGGRVREGGHSVPPETIRRRYRAGLRNLVHLYQPLVSTWRLYDASERVPRLIAERLATTEVRVYDSDLWTRVLEETRL